MTFGVFPAGPIGLIKGIFFIELSLKIITFRNGKVQNIETGERQ
jgi:hypothetical protein